MDFFFNSSCYNKVVARAFCSAVILLVLVGSAAVAQDDSDASSRAVTLFNAGQDAHEKNQFKIAIENYERALKIFPDFPEAELQRGHAYQSLGRMDEAEAAYRRAVELRDDWSLALASLGSVLVRKRDFTGAEKYLTDAIDLDEQNFPAYAAMTELRLRTNADPKTLKLLLARVSLLTDKANPTASIWASRAALEMAVGDRKSARASAARALVLDPKSQFALSTSADIALADRDSAAAELFVKRLETLDPRSETVGELRARVLLAQGKSTEAIATLDSITSPSAQTVELRKRIAALSITDPVELEKQLATDPKNPTLLAGLCGALRRTDPTKAIEYCRRAAEAAPQDVEPVIGYAAALVQAKRFEEAVMVLRKLATLAPDNSTVHANLGTALFQLKRYAEAKPEFRWLTERQPDNAIAFYFLGIVHDQLSELVDAAANYQQFLRLADPESSKLEIEKVNLRLPVIHNQLKEGKGKKRE